MATNTMYSMKPQYEIGKIDLPNVMYESKQIVFGTENPQANGNAPESIKGIIVRQDNLLEKLDALIKEVTNSKSSSVASCFSKERSKLANELLARGTPVDIVIHADPCKPPRSLVFILQQLNCYFRTLQRVHIHSATKKGNDLFPASESHEQRGPFEFIVTIIWSSLGALPRMCLNPATMSTIQGESNIVRFFGRLFGSYDTGSSYQSDIVADLCFDNCDIINSETMGKKEKITACKDLGNCIHKIENDGLVKALVSSTLQNCNGLPQGELHKWLQKNI